MKRVEEKEKVAQDQAASPDRRSFLKLAGALGLTGAFGMLAGACETEKVLEQASPLLSPAPLPTPEQISEMILPSAPVSTPQPSPLPGPISNFMPAPAAAPVPAQAPVPARARTPLRVADPAPQLIPSPSPTPANLPPSTPAITVGIERQRIAHLLRRAGFGASRQELDFFEKKGLPATVEYLLNYENVDDSALEKRLQSLNLDLTKIPDLQRWWLIRMIYTQRPLLEKMVLFWHGLLTSGSSRVGRADLMQKQNELFRRKALGRYDILLQDISRDPAMLIWLDSRNNRKSAPNENFARELMELFTMGPGNYSEMDIREAARAFTGYFLNAEGFFFNTNQHDYGSKVFLKTQEYLDGDHVIDIIMKQDATADFVCARLFSFFAYNNPDPEVMSRLKNAFWRSNYSIMEVMREMLTSEAFYSENAYRSRPKSPVELVAGAIRTLGIETDATGLMPLMTRMGQTIFNPPNVAGWPGGAAWLNSSTILERLNFANRVATDRKTFKPAENLDKDGVQPSRHVVDDLVGLLLDGNMSPQQRSILYDYADSVLKVAERDPSVRAIIYLILGSPDYQLG